MKNSSSGIAIVLVIFIVALASIIVINLTYSTFLATRMVGNVARQLQSEYILKSLVNFSGVLLQSDISKDDSFYDIWGIFHHNPRIPNEYLGIQDQSAEIYLEIVPLNSGINIRSLTASGKTHEALQKLMENLGFDDPARLAEEDRFGPKAGSIVTSYELVANIIDWQDADTDALNVLPNYIGFEDQVKDQFNTKTPFASIEELASLPGMTPRRLNAIAPYLYLLGTAKININTAYNEVLMVNNDRVDSNYVDTLISERESRGASLNDQDITNFQGNQGIKLLDFNKESDYYIIQAKVKYGLQRPYFLKAIIKKTQKFDNKSIEQVNYF